jgi:phosphatidylserine decarboxylase
MKIDPAAWPFAAGLAAVVLAVLLWHPWLAAPPAALLLFTLNFFRDPDRATPADRNALVSPADGKIIRADRERISIFMNVFDVHVCRAPVAGRVASIRHVAGEFLAAFKDEASEHNERTTIVVSPQSGAPVSFTLVAGLIARRIVCRTREGNMLSAGERVGLIRFGSRVDVDLPPGTSPAVRIGERVVAGESVLARLFSSS